MPILAYYRKYKHIYIYIHKQIKVCRGVRGLHPKTLPEVFCGGYPTKEFWTHALARAAQSGGSYRSLEGGGSPVKPAGPQWAFPGSFKILVILLRGGITLR